MEPVNSSNSDFSSRDFAPLPAADQVPGSAVCPGSRPALTAGLCPATTSVSTTRPPLRPQGHLVYWSGGGGRISPPSSLPPFLYCTFSLGTNKKFQSSKVTESFLLLDLTSYLVFVPGCHRTATWRTETPARTGGRGGHGREGPDARPRGRAWPGTRARWGGGPDNSAETPELGPHPGRPTPPPGRGASHPRSDPTGEGSQCCGPPPGGGEQQQLCGEVTAAHSGSPSPRWVRSSSPPLWSRVLSSRRSPGFVTGLLCRETFIAVFFFI